MCSGRYIRRQVATREKYSEALADWVLAHGLAGASLRPMAKTAGTSDRMLVYHFGGKAGVLRAALDVIAARNMDSLDAALPEQAMPAETLMPLIGAAMSGELFRPSLAVFFELAAMSLRGDADARAVGHRIASHFHAWLAARLTEPERAGELLGAIEGWGVLTAVGLDLPFPSG